MASMKICLKTYAKQDILAPVKIKLHARLPERIQAPVELTCHFQVKKYNDYYLLTLDVAGILTIACQRCLKAFQYNYCNKTELAVCGSEPIAEGLMDLYECMVAEEDEVDLAEILTDELVLFSPEKHEDLADCDVEIRQWIRDKSEIIETTLGL